MTGTQGAVLSRDLGLPIRKPLFKPNLAFLQISICMGNNHVITHLYGQILHCFLVYPITKSQKFIAPTFTDFCSRFNYNVRKITLQLWLK